MNWSFLLYDRRHPLQRSKQHDLPQVVGIVRQMMFDSIERPIGVGNDGFYITMRFFECGQSLTP